MGITQDEGQRVRVGIGDVIRRLSLKRGLVAGLDEIAHVHLALDEMLFCFFRRSQAGAV